MRKLALLPDSKDDGISIEHGIPIPETGRRQAKYPWASMKVGDSFLVATEKRSALNGPASAYANRHGVKFTTRLTDDGVRIWRIK